MALGRMLAMPLLFLLFVSYMILLGLSSWAYNRSVDTGYVPGMNKVTRDLITISLISSVVGLAAVISGIHHVLVGNRGGAAATSIIAALLSLLALGIASKHIHVGGNHSHRLRTLEAFAIITGLLSLVYAALMHANRGENDHPHGHHNTAPTTTKATV